MRSSPPINRCDRGWREPGSAHGSHSLGSTPNVVDLTAGDVTARIKYTPVVTAEAVSHPAFQATFHFGKPKGCRGESVGRSKQESAESKEEVSRRAIERHGTCTSFVREQSARKPKRFPIIKPAAVNASL